MCGRDSFIVVNFLLLTVISAVKSIDENDDSSTNTNEEDVSTIDIVLLVLIIFSYFLIFSLFTLICRKCYLKRRKLKRRYSTIKLSTTSDNGNNSRVSARPPRASTNAGCYDEIHLSQLGLDTNEPGLVNPNYMSNNNKYDKLREDLPQSEEKDKHTQSLEYCHFHKCQHGKEGCPRSLPIQIPQIIAPDQLNPSFPSMPHEVEVETHINENLSTREEIDDVYSLAALSEAHYSCISLNEDNPASQSASIAKLDDENKDENLEDPLSPADYEEFYSIADAHQESFSESEEENDMGEKDGTDIETKGAYGNVGRKSHQDRRKSSIDVPVSPPSFPRLTRKRSATSSDILRVLKDVETPNVPKPRVPRKPIRANTVDNDVSSKAN